MVAMEVRAMNNILFPGFFDVSPTFLAGLRYTSLSVMVYSI